MLAPQGRLRIPQAVASYHTCVQSLVTQYTSSTDFSLVAWNAEHPSYITFNAVQTSCRLSSRCITELCSVLPEEDLNILAKVAEFAARVALWTGSCCFSTTSVASAKPRRSAEFCPKKSVCMSVMTPVSRNRPVNANSIKTVVSLVDACPASTACCNKTCAIANDGLQIFR